MSTLKILAIEPFFGGSHQSFLENLVEHSSHQFTLITRPDRHWKWVMRAAAVEIARETRNLSEHFDLIFASDFLDLATLKGLSGHLRDIPSVVYFHENQLTYPVQVDLERDSHFGFTNLTTLHACNQAWFNSRFHLNEFRRGAIEFLRRTPAQRLDEWLEPFDTKASVVPLGVDLGTWDSARPERSGPLKILWNHRWEFDKNPEAFRDTLDKLSEHTQQFQLAICGQQYGEWPQAFDDILNRHQEKVVQFGAVDSRADYMKLVQSCDVVVSTAIHEFFGLSVVEASYAGCYPLVPNRLSYPEIFPPGLHAKHLYNSYNELVEKLSELADTPRRARTNCVATQLCHYDWSNRVREFDRLMIQASQQPGNSSGFDGTTQILRNRSGLL